MKCGRSILDWMMPKAIAVIMTLVMIAFVPGTQRAFLEPATSP